MKSLRFVLTVAVALLVAAAVLASRSRAAAAPPPPPRAQLAQFGCTHALEPANRSVSVQAVMRPLTGTRKLAIKFDLLEGTTGEPGAFVRGGDLGVWIAPTNPTLGQLSGDVWRLGKNVLNLDAPAAYQFRVSFRWTGARGRVLGTWVKYSRMCHQQELRPDLLVQSITVSPIAGHPTEALYTTVIANQGVSGAGPFEVLFVPGDGSSPSTPTVSFLGPGQSRPLTFTGPVCNAASPPSVTVDATDEVDDYNRSNNMMTAKCGGPTAP
jgi:hypothetical protein